MCSWSSTGPISAWDNSYTMIGSTIERNDVEAIPQTIYELRSAGLDNLILVERENTELKEAKAWLEIALCPTFLQVIYIEFSRKTQSHPSK